MTIHEIRRTCIENDAEPKLEKLSKCDDSSCNNKTQDTSVKKFSQENSDLVKYKAYI